MKLPMPASRSPERELSAKDLSHWRLVERFQSVLDEVSAGRQLHRSESDPRRKLDARSYFSLFLFGLFNPVISSMRGLCQASRLQRVQDEVCRGRVSLGSFSEAQDVFDPQILAAVQARLAAELPRSGDGLSAQIGKLDVSALRIVDSTIWKAVTRMRWASWRNQHKPQSAVRLHVKLRLLDALPVAGLASGGKLCEREAWHQQWESGEFYLGDRNYAMDYGLLQELEQAGCGYLLRLRSSATIETLEQNELSEADRAAGVVRDEWVRLGWRQQTHRLRLIVIEKPELSEALWLITNQDPAELSAGEAAELYRRRWEVEGFFRWLKCLLPCRQWLAEGTRGVAIQLYCAMICALLLAEHTGRQVSKRVLEMLRWHQMGLATDADLAATFERERARQERERAKTKKA